MRPATGAPAILSIGSNLGDRRLHVLRALDQIRRRMRVVRVSSLYETEPLLATPGSAPFINAAALVLHHGGAERLLAEILTLEKQLGRVRRQRNSPRVVDVDLILYDAAVRASPSLTLPHPRYRQREFVLAPLREVAPWWVDPVVQSPVASMRGEGEVRLIGGMRG